MACWYTDPSHQSFSLISVSPPPQTPADASGPIFLQFAALEEEHGLARAAMQVYDQAVRTVPVAERLPIYDVYLKRASDFFGIGKVRAPGRLCQCHEFCSLGQQCRAGQLHLIELAWGGHQQLLCCTCPWQNSIFGGPSFCCRCCGTTRR